MRNPNTIALGQPIGRHFHSATRHEVMPRNAMKSPQPSIECGNDQFVSSRPKDECQIAFEHSGERDHTEARAGKADRAGDGEGDERKSERLPEQAAQSRSERDVREGDRRAEVHGVDEEVRRREEVLERVRRVPALVPLEADTECEEVEDDGEPQKSVRRGEAGVLT
jgi:hypothetical protein